MAYNRFFGGITKHLCLIYNFASVCVCVEGGRSHVFGLFRASVQKVIFTQSCKLYLVGWPVSQRSVSEQTTSKDFDRLP